MVREVALEPLLVRRQAEEPVLLGGQIVPRAVSTTSVALRKPSFGQYQPSYVPT
jgi:hypothetical protein